jgi:hypothetical protein
MSKSQQVDFSKLSLDLSNLRMMPQKTEEKAIHVMIAIKPDRFFAVIDSILDDGYLGTENLIVLNDTKKLIVKEGNRRIAALKLIHGIFNIDDFALPDSIKTKINGLSSKWKNENKIIPCLVFDLKDIDKANKIVSLTHGKGEKASRDPWSSVAKARHNRDENGVSEPGLDLLEKYLKDGKNLTEQQKERWSGDYYITVLDEALKTLVKKYNYSKQIEVANNYPKIKNRINLEDILLNIGLGNISFNVIRDKNIDFTVTYGFPPDPTPASTTSSNQGSSTQQGSASSNNGSGSSTNNGNTNSGSSSGSSNGSSNSGTGTQTPKAAATNTQRHVRALLKKFTPRGNRQKVVTLKNELLSLNIKNNPIAFCFILRSMFEISAKAYCNDNSLSTTQPNGRDKNLSGILTTVTGHLTNGNSNTGMVKTLHGALTEITNPNRILSVTSMNQLVHSQNFSVQQSDICTLFSNIYPLLEAMN